MTYLTERQRDVLAFIADELDRNGVAPTLREISERFGFASTASAQKHIALLERKGFLRREKHQKRGLVLANKATGTETAAELPLLGLVAAGSPIESLPDPEPVAVPPDFVRSGDNFVLRVSGESMIDDGIHDGDLVVVQRTEEANDGDMVVALVDGEVTLKRIFRQGTSTVRLQPSNVAMAPILADAESVRVQGIVVGLLRRY